MLDRSTEDCHSKSFPVLVRPVGTRKEGGLPETRSGDDMSVLSILFSLHDLGAFLLLKKFWGREGWREGRRKKEQDHSVS